MFRVAKQQNILIDHVELQTYKHGRYDRRKYFFYFWHKSVAGKKTQVKNYSAELLFFFHLGFWSEEIP
jgi:hypothetical protein